VIGLDTPAGIVAAAGTANLDDAFLTLTGRSIDDVEARS